jgi:epoxyqueuosine reductase
MKLSAKDRQKLRENPGTFLVTAIRSYVAASAFNRLREYNNDPVVAEPVIGFADGRDPLFLEFKKKEIIGDFHLTPEEGLPIYLGKQNKPVKEKQPETLSVISIAFTPSKETRRSNLADAKMASPRWGRAYGRAFSLMSETLSQVVALLEAGGYQAVAPVCTRLMTIKISPEGLPYTDWSEKHAAYVAGLGTFGLHTSLITPAGVPLHIGSVITDLALTPTPRKYNDFRTYCRHYRDDSCAHCSQHCPSGAVNTLVFDGKKCMAYTMNELPKLHAKMHGDTGKDVHPMCALCQIKVPCEVRLPRA